MTNLDQRLDYKHIFKNLVKKAKITGDQIFGLCPVHDDNNPSFSADLKTGKCKCFSCGFEGNYISLYATLNHIDNATAFKRICEENNIITEQQKEKETKEKTSSAPINYSLQEYADEKHLPIAYLQTVWGLSDYQLKRGSCVKIPYYDINGDLKCVRYRNHPKSARRFMWRKGDSAILYGLQFLKDALENKRPVILVEGESDAQTLAYLGFDALGVPGASTFKASEVATLQGCKVFVHVEPDRGGDVFLRSIINIFREHKFTGELFRFSCNDAGAKDPSALYIQNGDSTAPKIQSLLDAAQKVDFMNEENPVTITGAPINLRIPAGYLTTDNGIWKLSEKINKPDELIIKTPIMITKRIKSYDEAEEKIEITFKRDNKFISGIFDRKTIFNSNNILELTGMGATISSANSKNVVKYLTDLETENVEALPVSYSTKTLGWIDENKFLPFHAPGVELDANGSLSQWAGSCVRKGNLANWCELMRPHRDRYKFRFILAASFTAPLLKILKCRSFIVYNWADSRGGKTAALKAALSVWGNPDRMMITFNATSVALERMASFFCDIPLGIDERQLAGSNQEGIEKIFYMLGNGISKGRGTKNGGIESISTWRTVAMTTGEEPVTNSNTMTGVSTRTIEIVGAPFDTEQQAQEMHKHCSDTTGEAGFEFMAQIIKAGNDPILQKYNYLYSEIQKMAGDINGSHLASLAAVATADALESEILFKEPKDKAERDALTMIRSIVADMKINTVPDVNVSACAYILDFYNANKERYFSLEGQGQGLYGWTFNGSYERSSINIFANYLKKILEDGGFSYRKTMSFLKNNGGCETDGKNEHYTVVKKLNGRSVRVVALNLYKLQEITGSAETQQQELPF